MPSNTTRIKAMKKTRKDTDLQRLEKIKKLVIIAIFSDDEFMERLVLKGGNALDLVHHITPRASLPRKLKSFSRGTFVPPGTRCSMSRW